MTFICLYINRGFLQIYLMHCQTVLGCIHFANDLCRVDVIKTEQHQEPVNNNSKFNFFSYHFIWRNIVLFCRKFHINGEFSIRVYQTACPHNLFTKNLFFFEIIGDNDIDEIRLHSFYYLHVNQLALRVQLNVIISWSYPTQSPKWKVWVSWRETCYILHIVDQGQYSAAQ